MMQVEKSVRVIGRGGGDQDSRDREYRQKYEANPYFPPHMSSFISCIVALSTRAAWAAQNYLPSTG
jgi:hypothetical protein